MQSVGNGERTRPWGQVPLYGQVLGVLRQRITDGVFAVGDQLSPEDQLAAEFSVSRATIRQAVGELVREGLVARQQGRGTFVLQTADRFGKRYHGSLASILSKSPASRAIRVDIANGVTLPSRIADALSLDTPVGTVVRRPRAIDNEIYSYSENYLPDPIGRLVTKEGLAARGMIGHLAELGVKCVSAQQTIRAQLADVEVCKSMEMDFASPVLYAERLVRDAEGTPVQLVRTWYRADLYEIVVNISLDSSEPQDGERPLLLIK